MEAQSTQLETTPGKLSKAFNRISAAGEGALALLDQLKKGPAVEQSHVEVHKTDFGAALRLFREEWLKLYVELPDGRQVFKPDYEAVASFGQYHELGRIEDKIKAVNSLGRIQRLSLAWLECSWVEAVAALTDLEELEIFENEINDVRPLAGLHQLRFLDIGNNRITDPTPLSNLANLETLNIFGNPLQEFSALGKLRKLKTLVLGIDCEVRHGLEPLSELTALETLLFESSFVFNLDPLLKLPALKKVELRGKGVDEKAWEVVAKLRNKGVHVEAPQ